MSTTSPGPSRRSLVKGAAWSVPVVAVASAAPAVAASPPPVTPPSFQPGSACKFSGGSCDGWKHAYRAVFCMTNDTEDAIVVNITEIRVNGTAHPAHPSQVTVPPTGESFCFYTIADDTGNSANGTLEFDYNYTYVEDGETRTVAGTASTGEQNDLPPCDGCETDYISP